jgi:hypothetical protein
MPIFGILAGAGQLPIRLAERLSKNNADFKLYDLNAKNALPLGQVKRFVNHLKADCITHIIMAGTIKRPSLLKMRPDLRAMRILFKNWSRIKGDDGLLRVVASELEKDGITVMGAHDILPELFAKEGYISHYQDIDLSRLQKAFHMLYHHMLADLGQALLLCGDDIFLEDQKGTDVLIKKAKNIHGQGHKILLKLKKPQQDMRFDLPTVGPKTLDNMHAKGINCLVIEAGGVIILEQEIFIKKAADYHITIYGITAKTYERYV